MASTRDVKINIKPPTPHDYAEFRRQMQRVAQRAKVSAPQRSIWPLVAIVLLAIGVAANSVAPILLAVSR